MKASSFFAVAKRLLALPTAAYHEHFVVAAIQEYLAPRKQISCKADRFGNLHLNYHGSPDRSQAPIVATAHLDHPALGWVSNLRQREFEFESLGRLPARRIVGAPVCIYNVHDRYVEMCVRARVAGLVAGTEQHFRVKAEAQQSLNLVGPGSFAVWDLPPLQRRGDRIYARACDDLAGLSVGLCWLDQLVESGVAVNAGLLLTRAEEIGFGGMLAAVHGNDLGRNCLYVNIECSSTRSGARLGEGPVIRVGDKRQIFDPAVAGALNHVAERCRAENPGFRFQRKLMDSGTCEATALQQAGFTTGAVALPLGNYHNLGRNKLQREIIDERDALMLVDLLAAVATHPDGLAGAGKSANESLSQLLDSYRAGSEPRLIRAPL
jgi:putative aminopeptidase FrvX